MLAAGHGIVATMIVNIARAAGAPVIKHPELADALVELSASGVIPHQALPVVAEVLSLLFTVDVSVGLDEVRGALVEYSA